MKKKGPSEEAMKAFYKAVEPALIRIAKEERKKEDENVKRTSVQSTGGTAEA